MQFGKQFLVSLHCFFKLLSASYDKQKISLLMTVTDIGYRNVYLHITNSRNLQWLKSKITIVLMTKKYFNVQDI